jgi:heme A synthase
MNGHSRLVARSWILALVLVAFIAGHGILFYVLSHKLPVAFVASGLIALVVIKHLGLLSPLHALLRRRLRNRQ